MTRRATLSTAFMGRIACHRHGLWLHCATIAVAQGWQINVNRLTA
jgi:hypothetical protein